MRRSIVVTGSTGYLGRALCHRALDRGHHVRAFVRAGSEHRVPAGVPFTIGDSFDVEALTSALARSDTLVHLVGTPRPNPRKAKQFRDVDLRSAAVAAAASVRAGIAHFVYVSVAHPAPVMEAYIAARREAEATIRRSGIPATIVRPWYVLGPGHWWPSVLLPLYWVLERVPSTRQTALRLGLVRHTQMTTALVRAIEDGPRGFRVIDVSEIRAISEE